MLQVLVSNVSPAMASVGLSRSILGPDPELGEGRCARSRRSIPVGVTNAVAVVAGVVVAHHRVSETEDWRSEAQ